MEMKQFKSIYLLVGLVLKVPRVLLLRIEWCLVHRNKWVLYAVRPVNCRRGTALVVCHVIRHLHQASTCHDARCFTRSLLPGRKAAITYRHVNHIIDERIQVSDVRLDF